MRFRIFLFVIFAGGAARAEPICWNDDGGFPTLGFEERNAVLAEEKGPQSGWRAGSPRRDFYGHRPPNLKSVLATLGLTPLIEEEDGRRLSYDSQYQGRILIDRVRALGPRHPYIARLAETQIRAISFKRGAPPLPPERNWVDIAPAGSPVAVMAEQDFAYLAGVDLFHRQKYEEARAAFAAVGQDSASPHRDAGRLMEVKALSNLAETAETYRLARRYREEATGEAKESLDIREDLIAQYGGDPSLAAAHLEKIFRRVSGLPLENEALGFRVQQAGEDFDLFFINELDRRARPHLSPLPHDWWLRDEYPGELPYFAAVQSVARKYDGVDWVQAYHSSAAYDRDNTWFLGPDFDVRDPAYGRVTEHAFHKWKAGGSRWAMIVAKRMAPNSAYVPQIAKYAQDLSDKADGCGLTPADYVVYARIAHHLVRVYSTAGDYERAFAVIRRILRNNFYPSQAAAIEPYRAFMKFLTAKGELSLVRSFDERLTTDRDASGPSDWRFSLLREANIWAAPDQWTLAKSGPAELQAMLNMMPMAEIETLLTPPKGKPRMERDLAARAAAALWMRAFIFGDDAMMARAEPHLLQYHRRLVRYFRQAKAAPTKEARDFAFAVMVLRHPGLTPYVDSLSLRNRFDISVYDRDNPVEGNWWCAADDRARVGANESRLRSAFFGSAFSSNSGTKVRNWRRSLAWAVESADEASLDGAWKRFRRTYPPFRVISNAEQSRLAAVPRAADWLAEKVRAYVESPEGQADQAAPRDERIPESLHRIVEVTRYACHRSERGNAATSQWAYSTLHRHYGDTVWAAETPYWYDRINRGWRRNRR